MQNSQAPKLVITIDTEEDNWGEYDRASYTVANVKRIPGLQRMFDARGVRPTYLISYPMATDPEAIEVLGRCRDEKRCEVGTHPHPWNTPPLEEQRTTHNSYINHLEPDLQYRKLRTLHDTITKNFGRPTSYRSGRWGFSDDVARNLMRLGYVIDTSLTPLSDWTRDGGPDYRQRSLEPFVYRMSGEAAGGTQSLLEVPATIDFIQRRRVIAASAYWSIARLPLGGKAIAALDRTGLLNHVCLSPEIHDSARMIALIRALVKRGVRVLNLFFHSPSLLPGCAPFVRTEADAVSFLARIDDVLAYAQSAGIGFSTLSELSAEEIGATAVRVVARAA